MRNRIVGAIGALWGFAILVNGVFGERIDGGPAYNTGTAIGLLLGAAMFLAGLYYLIQGDNPPPWKAMKKSRQKKKSKFKKPRPKEMDDEV